ncbi:MAG: sulfur oxidation c-type cytochrome SoxA [Burkholderiaceae bacterium]
MRRLASLSAVLGVLLTHHALADSRQSTYSLMSPSIQAMQNDMTQNPALFSILDGEALWKKSAVANDRSCASCHGDVKQSMRGVFATFPKNVQGALVNLEAQINRCRTSRQGLVAFPYESKELLGLSSLIAHQSRGMPIQASKDPKSQRDLMSGTALYFKRMGQLNLSCAQCHDQRSGYMLAGVTIPQAHPTGYPIYRLEWQSMGSLQRRLRNCLSGVRAELYAFGSAELTQIELYLMHRADGMTIESPGVRP